MAIRNRLLFSLITLVSVTSAAAAEPLAAIPPCPPPLDFPLPVLHAPGKDLSIPDFGAVADGQTVNTVAIQKAIDACSSAGGGTVVIPPGTFYLRARGSSSKKMSILRVEKEAILKGSTNSRRLSHHRYALKGLAAPSWPLSHQRLSALMASPFPARGQSTARAASAQAMSAGGARTRHAFRNATRHRAPPSPRIASASRSNHLHRPGARSSPPPPKKPALTLVGAGSNRPAPHLLHELHQHRN